MADAYLQFRLYGGATSRRPAMRPHAPTAPPFDPNDDGGQVHTTLPPEQVIPEHFADPAWLRADFTGVQIEGEYSPTASDDIIRNGGVTMTTGRWAGTFVPFLEGANTTPPTMIMTPFLPIYPRNIQDIVLTEHAERGYDDFVISPEPWGADVNGYEITPAKTLAWVQYVMAWGFRPVIWRGDPHWGLDAMFRTLYDAGAISFYVHGKEVDQVMSGEEYEASLQTMDRFIAGRLPIGAHFSGNGDRGMGYPIGPPRYNFIHDWSLYDGRVHLCQQLIGLNNDGETLTLAGLQGAAMYYARLHVNCGIGDAAKGPGAPNSRVIAFETMSTAQLYGKCSEDYGNLRSWQLICGTRSDPRCRPVSGSASGLREPLTGKPV